MSCFGIESVDKKIKRGYAEIESQNFGAAIEIFEEAFQISFRDERLALIYCGLGRCYFYQAKYKEALEYFKKWMMVIKKTYGVEHELYSNALYHIAMAHECKGTLNNALMAIEEALELRTKLFGDKDDRVGQCYFLIGSILLRKMDYEKSVENLKKAEALMMETNLNYGPLLALISVNFEMMRDFDQSLEYRERQLEWMRKRADRRDSPAFKTALYNYGQLCVELALKHEETSNMKEALCYRKKHLECCTQEFGEGDPTVAVCLYNLAMSYLKAEQKEKAVECLEQCLKIRKVKLRIRDPLTAETQEVLENVKKGGFTV